MLAIVKGIRMLDNARLLRSLLLSRLTRSLLILIPSCALTFSLSLSLSLSPSLSLTHSLSHSLSLSLSDEFRSIEASLYQVQHRTTSNEPLRKVQQTRGQGGLEAWHAMVRRYDQRNMSEKNSAYAVLISNISEKDRAKDVEQFDDILKTFINEMNKFESRFGGIRDEEKMFAVEKLMPESLLNYRFRGTTMSFSDIVIALENIIVDKVTTVPSSKNRRNDISAPMETGMAAKEDGESASQEGDQRIMDLALQSVYKGTCKGKHNWNEKGGKGGKDGGKNSLQKGSGKKRGKGQEKDGKGDTRVCWSCGKLGHLAAKCVKGSWNRSLNAVEEDKGDIRWRGA